MFHHPIKLFFTFLLLACTVATHAQDAVVEWNFPSTTHTLLADGGSPYNTTMGVSTSGGTNAITCVNSGASSQSAFATGWDNGDGIKCWTFQVNTTGFVNLTLSSKQISSNTGPKNFKVQYRIGLTGTWTDLSGGAINVSQSWAGSGNASNIALPATLENVTSVYFRYILTSNLRVDQSTVGSVVDPAGSSRIDDIVIKGHSTSFFRSRASGNWNNKNTWQQSDNGITYVNAYATPSEKSNKIVVENGHIVSVVTSLIVDQLEIDKGGQVNYTATAGITFTINDGTGIDLLVNGTFDDSGPNSVVWAGSATWQLGNTATLIRTRSTSSNNWKMRYDGGIAVIPATAFWVIRKNSSDDPTVSTVGMYYPNLLIENYTGSVWLAPAASSFTGSSGGFPTIKGKLDIGGSGSGDVIFTNENTHATPALVLGNLMIKAGSEMRNQGTGFEVQGDMMIDGSLSYAGTGARLIKLGGTKVQHISGGGTCDLWDLQVSKPFNDITLMRDITVDNSIALISGPFILNAFAVTVMNGDVNSISRTAGFFISETDAGIGYGTIHWMISNTPGNHIIPFGLPNNTQIPVIINHVSGNSGMVSVSTYPTAANNMPFPAGVTHVRNISGSDNSNNTVDRYWVASKDGTSGIVNVTVTYAASENATTGNINMEAQMWNASRLGWALGLGSQSFVPGSPTSTVTINNAGDLSVIAIANQFTPLPVELLSFNGAQQKNVVQLNWATATEFNNDYFLIERSQDGITFETIGKVKGAGSVNHTSHYIYTDEKPYQGTAYYRLRQTDYDGSFSNSLIAPVNFKLSSFDATVYNSGSGVMVLVQCNQSIEIVIEIFDMAARRLVSETRTIPAGMYSYKVPELGMVNGGAILIRLSDSDEQIVKKIAY